MIDRKAQSPEPDSQGSHGDWGDSFPDNEKPAYGLDLGSTQILSTVSQPRETPDPSGQAEGKANWLGGTTMERSPPPYHEQDEFLGSHAHKGDMVWSSETPQSPLEVHIEGEDSPAMILAFL